MDTVGDKLLVRFVLSLVQNSLVKVSIANMTDHASEKT